MVGTVARRFIVALTTSGTCEALWLSLGCKQRRSWKHRRISCRVDFDLNSFEMLPHVAIWCTASGGMIRASGVRGPGFNSPERPLLFYVLIADAARRAQQHGNCARGRLCQEIMILCFSPCSQMSSHVAAWRSAILTWDAA